jgi:transposase
MKITTIGIDLAKNVFQVHGVDERGKPVLKKQVKRDQMAAFFAKLPVCLIGMEACGSAHHWARRLQGLGHTVRLMAPQFVKPYVKANKNDVADAEAICEAVTRPNMRFVPVKSIEQQAVLSLHSVRQGFVKARTSQANQIRSLVGEFGLVMPQGIMNVRKRVPEVVENASSELPAAFRHLVDRMLDHLKELDRQVGELEAQIKAWHRSSELSQKLEKIPGIGPLGASALVASIADARSFDNGRQVSAWIGVVPRQHSSGGKPPYWGSASVATFICARCSFMVRVPRLLPRSARRPSIPGWPVCCIGAIRTSQRSRWRTRMHASRGRYLPTTGSSSPITSR